MAEYHKVLSLERYGIVGEILLVPAKDWTKSPVPFPAEIARTILKRNIGNWELKIVKRKSGDFKRGRRIIQTFKYQLNTEKEKKRKKRKNSVGILL